MLIIKVPSREFFNDSKQEFITIKGCEIELEHSLLSVSKWESKWKKSFISNDNKTTEETLDYIRCMMLNDRYTSYVNYLTQENINDINNYISDSMTATVFYDDNTTSKKKETITSELIYYWMIASNIPMECEKWHLNRLLTLIRICSIKNAPPKKMSKRDIMDRNKALNEARRKKLHTRG